MFDLLRVEACPIATAVLVIALYCPDVLELQSQGLCSASKEVQLHCAANAALVNFESTLSSSCFGSFVFVRVKRIFWAVFEFVGWLRRTHERTNERLKIRLTRCQRFNCNTVNVATCASLSVVKNNNK